ncbi:MAG: hypothetical protein JJE47_03675 [Acidimicrobiia bacterium]|nr:hypothetical protein [Acidimicrobiia bacterium]
MTKARVIATIGPAGTDMSIPVTRLPTIEVIKNTARPTPIPVVPNSDSGSSGDYRYL